MLRFFKVLLIIIASCAALVYGGVFLAHKVIFPIKTAHVPTSGAVTDGRLTLGVQAHAVQPTDIEGYIEILARQLKRYNEVAPELWPDNTLTDQSLIIEGIRGNKFWLITPDGAIKPLSKTAALGYGIKRLAYFNGFSLFDGGMYLAVSEEDITNYLIFQNYLHLGTYDAFITFAHEGFHITQQPKWQVMSHIPNRERNGFLDNIPARATRALLQKQLLQAVSEPGNIQLILEALATYDDWKTKFPEECKNSVYFDRVEGTAFYYELISCLYAAYPEQISNGGDLDQALALLATREDIYIKHGLIAEGYTVGGFSCVLLNRLESGWQEQLINDAQATPAELLFKHFAEETLPAPQQLSQAGLDAVSAEINTPAVNRGKPLFFRVLYDMLF